MLTFVIFWDIINVSLLVWGKKIYGGYLMDIKVKPTRFIFPSASAARRFYDEFMGQCSLVEDDIVLCRTASSIDAAKRMGGTKIPDTH